MIRPKRALIIGLAAARISRNAASRLIRMTSSNSSSFIRMARLSRVTPALLTRMSSLRRAPRPPAARAGRPLRRRRGCTASAT